MFGGISQLKKLDIKGISFSLNWKKINLGIIRDKKNFKQSGLPTYVIIIQPFSIAMFSPFPNRILLQFGYGVFFIETSADLSLPAFKVMALSDRLAFSVNFFSHFN